MVRIPLAVAHSKMNLNDFNESQRQAILDLAVLAMYADGHLAAAEDDRVQRLLATLCDASDYERTLLYDAAVGRVSRYTTATDTQRTHAIALTRSFTTPEQRRQVEEILSDLMASDTKVSSPENAFLAAIRAALQV
jgi:hypothetical protein